MKGSIPVSLILLHTTLKGLLFTLLGLKVGKTKEAIVDYTKSLDLKPRFADAYNNRGLAELRLGNNQRACYDFKKAIFLGSQNTEKWLKSEEGAWCRNM